jgi:hypothetical protein
LASDSGEGPFFVLSAVASIGVAGQHHGGAWPMEVLPFGDRAANAVISYSRYLGRQRGRWIFGFYPYREA